MKVVLQQDVKKVGKKGEVVEVSKGYGINYLMPKGLAVAGTKDAIAKAQVLSKQKREKEEKAQDTVSGLVKRVHKKKVQIEANAAKGGRLYGSLSSADVSGMLAKKWGVAGMDVKIDVSLAQPIKETGKYPLDVSISGAGEKKEVEIILSVVLE